MPFSRHSCCQKFGIPNCQKFGIVGYRLQEYYGIPQGSALSALLSNIYLVDFDEYMFKLGQTIGFIYRRYCDDIL